MNIKKIAFGATTTAFMLGSLAIPAFATGTGYGSQPGWEQAGDVGAQCGTGAASGAFGAFSGTANVGQQGSEVHGFVLADKAAGVSLGSETGPSNSSVCGNPQN